MTAPIVRAAGAAFRYAGHAPRVGPFDLTVRPGEFHLLSGASGAGKSTLARLLTGLIPHLYRGDRCGVVEIDGADSASLPFWRLAERVGFVGQNAAAQLLCSTVSEEIRFGLETLGLPSAAIATRLEAALSAFDLHPLAARHPATLSGGEQQRVVLAAVTAREPAALVLDEPLAMLDAEHGAATVATLERLRAAGTAVVVCEHRRAPFAALPDVVPCALPAPAPRAESPPEWSRRVPPFRLAVSGLGVRLDGRVVLREVELTLAGGRVVAVTGPNGAGKTTLLRALTGLQRHGGHVTLIASGAPRPPRLGLCFQDPDRQIFNATVREEIAYGCAALDERLYRDVIVLLGLERYERHSPLLLSEGEKKRVTLATLLVQPGLCGICLDEPTLGQDEHQKTVLGRIVRRLAAAGYLCLVATHDRAWAAEWCDETLLVRAGRVTETNAAPALAVNRSLPLAESRCSAS